MEISAKIASGALDFRWWFQVVCNKSIGEYYLYCCVQVKCYNTDDPVIAEFFCKAGRSESHFAEFMQQRSTKDLVKSKRFSATLPLMSGEILFFFFFFSGMRTKPTMQHNHKHHNFPWWSEQWLQRGYAVLAVNAHFIKNHMHVHPQEETYKGDEKEK